MELCIPQRQRLSVALITITFALHLVLWAPLIALRIWAFKFERVYREFDMKLPVVTNWLLSGGFWALFAVMGVCLVLDLPAMLVLARRAALRRAWSVLMVATPLFFAGIAAYALMTPMMQLMETLGR